MLTTLQTSEIKIETVWNNIKHLLLIFFTIRFQTVN